MSQTVDLGYVVSVTVYDTNLENSCTYQTAPTVRGYDNAGFWVTYPYTSVDASQLTYKTHSYVTWVCCSPSLFVDVFNRF